ncbi:AEC family transporter [Roseiarcaceae bacterium H3SJ34-1]|uniref:AEC family transporter n=1 Tax=Terripilifer ovatus TaxID=3032367 RepID=UPI003AB9AA16|nr:AEC family transporter [Roseiarcaceae bacterium H3SJ34-1]
MQIFNILLDVVGPVFLIAFVGYLWARSGKPLDSGFVALLVNTVSTPALVIDTLTRSGLTFGTLGTMGLASVLTMGVTALCGYALVRALGERIPVYLPSMIWANGGNMGLPMCLFAFGQTGLALAIGYFALSSMTNYTFGQAIAAGGMKAGDVVRMPIIWAIIVALILLWTGWALPPIVQRSLGLLGGITVPLMLMSLGYSLASLRITSWKRSTIFALARLLGGFAIGWGVSLLLGLDGLARGVIVIQSSMPPAVLNYLWAARYGNEPEEVAGLVVLSTFLSLAFLPVFLWTVM